MEPEFWKNKWRSGQIGFHRERPGEVLTAQWKRLGLPKGARVLVPLCGKSHDLRWLMDQGFDVTGIELSELAVTAFFDEQNLHPERSREGAYDVWRVPGLTILNGNLFDFAEVAAFDAVYDRAATIALPPDLRTRYAAIVASALKPGAQGLLITIERPEADVGGPPFHVDTREVTRLYGEAFTIEALHPPEASELERCYQIARRGTPA